MAHRSVHRWGEPRRMEGKASTSTIYPGHLVEMTSAAADTWKLRATAGGAGEKAVAFEDELQGKNIDTVSTANNRIQVNIYKSGEECVARLSWGQSVTKGDKLMAYSDGTVRKLVADSSGTVVENTPIAIALETLDLGDSSSSEDNTDNKLAIRWL